jgi:hypothetical protein
LEGVGHDLGSSRREEAKEGEREGGGGKSTFKGTFEEARYKRSLSKFALYVFSLRLEA